MPRGNHFKYCVIDIVSLTLHGYSGNNAGFLSGDGSLDGKYCIAFCVTAHVSECMIVCVYECNCGCRCMYVRLSQGSIILLVFFDFANGRDFHALRRNAKCHYVFRKKTISCSLYMFRLHQTVFP